MITLVDVTVTVFPPLEVSFAWDMFGESAPIVPTESKDAFEAAFEDVVKFGSVPPVASNSNGAVNSAPEGVSDFEDVPAVASDKKAHPKSVVVFALPRVLFA